MEAKRFTAGDLLELGEEFHGRIREVQDDYGPRINNAESQEDYDRLQQEQNDAFEALEQGFKARLDELKETGGDRPQLYNQDLAGVNLNELVYRGDRDSLIRMLSEPKFAYSVVSVLKEQKPYNARKELLTRGLKLTPAMAPLVYTVVNRCREALQLEPQVEVYVYQDSIFNAACYPPVKDKVLLMLTSSLLEKFTEDELAFVVGHEIGHYLFEHTRYPVQFILGHANASPLDAMRMYAWVRNAEVTADRVGMLCCQNFKAAASSFFKLSSGVTGSRLNFELDEFVQQLRDLEAEMTKDDDPEVWYSTHPFSPMRIKALDIYVKGQGYKDVVGQESDSAPTAEQTDEAVEELLSMMEPSYLYGDTDVNQKARQFMLSAGYLMAAINGVVEDSELEALSQILGEEEDIPAKIAEVRGKSADDIRTTVVTLSKELNHLADQNLKMQMIQDLAIISYADGELDDSEMDCLEWLAEGLTVPPYFVEQVLANARAGVD